MSNYTHHTHTHTYTGDIPVYSEPTIQFYLHRFPGFNQISDTLDTDNNNDLDCPICGSIFLEKHGIIVCKNCGAELGPEITSQPDAQYSSEQTSQCNTVHNPLLSQFNYTTQIAGGDSQLKRLNKWAHNSYLEKTLAREFKNLEDICRQAHLSVSLAQTAQLLYKEIIDIFLKKAETKKRPVGLHLACLYQACKQAEITRSHRELSQICGVNESRVIRSCKIYLELIGKRTEYTTNCTPTEISDSAESSDPRTNPHTISPTNSQINTRNINSKLFDQPNSNGETHTISPTSPINIETNTIDAYFKRFTDAVGLNQTQKTLVKNVVDKVKILGILNESPPSVVAGIIYWISVIHNLHLDKTVIAVQTGISEVTIVKVYKNLRPYLNQLIE